MVKNYHKHVYTASTPKYIYQGGFVGEEIAYRLVTSTQSQRSLLRSRQHLYAIFFNLVLPNFYGRNGKKI